MAGCMQIFILLFQFLEPNAACTKLHVTKFRIAPLYVNKNRDVFLKLEGVPRNMTVGG